MSTTEPRYVGKKPCLSRYSHERTVGFRDPAGPLMKLRSRAKARARLAAAGVANPFYTLPDYQEIFAHAGPALEVRRVHLSRGLKYCVDNVVNGLTHARHAFVGAKRGKA